MVTAAHRARSSRRSDLHTSGLPLCPRRLRRWYMLATSSHTSGLPLCPRRIRRRCILATSSLYRSDLAPTPSTRPQRGENGGTCCSAAPLLAPLASKGRQRPLYPLPMWRVRLRTRTRSLKSTPLATCWHCYAHPVYHRSRSMTSLATCWSPRNCALWTLNALRCVARRRRSWCAALPATSIQLSTTSASTAT